MSLGDALEKGRIWGSWLGAGFGVLLALLLWDGDLGKLFGAFLGSLTIGALSGIAIALAIQSLIGTLKFLNLVFALVGGFIVSVFTALIGGVAGYAGVVIIPILLLLRKYLAKKSPEWLERAVSEAIVCFLTSLIYTCLVLFFQRATGVELLGHP